MSINPVIRRMVAPSMLVRSSHPNWVPAEEVMEDIRYYKDVRASKMFSIAAVSAVISSAVTWAVMAGYLEALFQ